jgi:hypothetical protein
VLEDNDVGVLAVCTLQQLLGVLLTEETNVIFCKIDVHVNGYLRFRLRLLQIIQFTRELRDEPGRWMETPERLQCVPVVPYLQSRHEPDSCDAVTGFLPGRKTAVVPEGEQLNLLQWVSCHRINPVTVLTPETR